MGDCYHLNPAATCTFMQLKFINFSRKLLFLLFVNATLPAAPLSAANDLLFLLFYSVLLENNIYEYWVYTCNCILLRTCRSFPSHRNKQDVYFELKTQSSDIQRNLKWQKTFNLIWSFLILCYYKK